MFQDLFNNFWNKLSAPIPPWIIGWFRFFFGVLMVYVVFDFYRRNIIDAVYVSPTYHFKYLSIDLYPEFSPDVIYVLFCALMVSAVCITVGLFYRVASVAALLIWSYFFFLEKAYYTNPSYLILLLLLALVFIPAHRVCSFDQYYNATGSRQLRTAHLWMLRGVFGLMYFFAGIHKLHPDWLRGQPVGIDLQSLGGSSLLPIQSYIPELSILISYSGLAVDLLALPLLVWKRTRYVMIVILVVFHSTNWLVFSVRYFPILGVLSVLVFFPPEFFRNWNLLSQKWGIKPVESNSSANSFIQVIFVIFIGIQIILPLRPHLLKGDVLWTGRGSRFSWVVFMQRKSGNLSYIVENRTHSITFTEEDLVTGGMLKKWQYLRMVGQPDLILQYANYLDRRVQRNRGWNPTAVRVNNKVSLNGRRPATLVKKSKNLLQEDSVYRITTKFDPSFSKEANMLQRVREKWL